MKQRWYEKSNIQLAMAGALLMFVFYFVYFDLTLCLLGAFLEGMAFKGWFV